jgi:uncharacterized membrane protein
MDKVNQQPEDPVKIHHRQLFTSIYLPLGIVGLIIIGAGVLLILGTRGGSGHVQSWSSISMIIMVLPFIILSIVVFAFLVLAVYLLAKANRKIPPKLQSMRTKTIQFANKSQNAISKTATPFIKIQSILSGMRAFFHINRRKL